MKSRRSLPAAVALLTLALAALAPAQQDPLRATPIQPAPAAPAEGGATKLLEFANMLYEYRNYSAAVLKYDEFIKASPNDPQAEKAWYRLADCYRLLKRPDHAKRCYDEVIKRWPNGPYAATSAHIMAILAYNDNQYEQALPYLRMAVQKTDKPEAKAECQYFLGYVQQQLKRIPEAIKEYKALLALDSVADEYRDRAELALAELQFSEGNSAEALKHYANLAANAKDPTIRDDARFTAGKMSLQAGDNAKGKALLMETLKSSSNSEYQAQAQNLLILQAFEQKNYDEVISTYALAPLATKDEKLKAQLELLVAHSTRELGDHAQAAHYYANVERTFRNSQEGTLAGYYRLQCLHAAGDKDLPNYVDRFVAAQSAIDASSRYIDLAMLIKAETLYERKDYENSAAAYRNVKPENIDPKLVPVRLYKMGWALTESGNFVEGVDMLGQFISQYPKSELLPSALVKRAMTFMKLEHFDSAQADYQRLAREFPALKDTEYALHQVALIHAQKRDVPQMVAAYQALLAQFPKTNAASEAYYMIGGGLFDLKKYQECIDPLSKARTMDPSLKAKASLRILLAYFHLENVEKLKAETDAFPQAAAGDLKVPIQVYHYLARSFYDGGKFKEAEPYLLKITSTKKVEETPTEIFRQLADVRIKLGKDNEAIQDLTNYLTHQLHPEQEARARMDMANCYRKLTRFDEAKEQAEGVLQKSLQGGRINSEARIMLGDIAMDQKDYNTAARHYVVPCEFGNDEVMVPRALDRMVRALEAQGKTQAADDYRQRLKARFPQYTADAN